MKLIALAGKSGAGKTTAIEAALGVMPGAYNFALSDPLKLMIDIGLSTFDVFQVDRMAEIPGLGVTRRHLEQTLGTEWGRNLVHQDIWAKIAAAKILKNKEAGVTSILDGIRFPNEVAMVKALGGVLIYIDRPDAPSVHEHSSEQYDIRQHCSIVITNNCPKEEFDDRVTEVFQELAGGD